MKLTQRLRLAAQCDSTAWGRSAAQPSSYLIAMMALMQLGVSTWRQMAGQGSTQQPQLSD